ncbi:helix-turn-helix domain-containing protein [Aeromonas sp. AE23HZ002T15]
MSPRMEVVARQPQLELALISSQGGGYPRHTHEEYVLSANLSGCEHIWFDGREQVVEPGQVTLYNPLTMQASRFEGETRFISLHLGTEWVSDLLGEAGLLLGRTAPAFQEGVHNNQTLFNALLALHRSPSANQQEEGLVRLLAVLQRIAPPHPKLLQGRLPQLLDYMRSHLSQEIGLDDLCQIACCSKFHLVRSFQQVFHVPPIHYFNQLRLMEARRRLLQGERPAQVALALGFYDQSHMSNAFRRVMGITPSRYGAPRTNSP